MVEHAGYHEPLDSLSQVTIERHHAITSLIEELEAVDWYDQRVNATKDADLRAILEHNRDEEREHTAMALEWLRRQDPIWDETLRTYLFTEAPITELEKAAEAENGASDASRPLAIGNLREEPPR